MSEAIAIKNREPATERPAPIEKEEPQQSQVDWKGIWKPLSAIAGVFLVFFWLPIDNSRFTGAVIESLALAKWYAQEHVLLCLVPAFFIAGAISVFVSQAAVMKYLGAAPKRSVLWRGLGFGPILAVCSCTVLPLFAGIWKRGAGLGPAIAFLYSGPAINVLGHCVDGPDPGPGTRPGPGRGGGGVQRGHRADHASDVPQRRAGQGRGCPAHARAGGGAAAVAECGLFCRHGRHPGFANWGKPAEPTGLWHAIYSVKWLFTGFFAIVLGVLLVKWFRVKAYKVVLAAAAVLVLAVVFPHQPLIAFSAGIIALAVLTTTTRGETESWFLSTWDFAKQILPLLFAGVLVAGLLLGRPGSEGLIPSQWISGLVGGNSLWANLFSSVVGAFMYFATLTEVPISAGASGCRHGQGSGPGPAVGGPGLEPAQHAGDPQRHGHQKDGGLCEPGGGHGHHQRDDFRPLFRLTAATGP